MKYLGTITDSKDIATKGYADKMKIPYLTCATAAGTAAKTTTLVSGTFTSADLVSGAQVLVKFTNANGVASPTLSVNGTTAKSIRRYGTTAPSTSAATSWNAGSVVLFTYDGTYWQQVGYLNSTYSEISVANITNGTGSSTGTITGRRAKAAVEAFAPVQSVNGSTGAVSLTASDVGALADSTTYVSSVNGNSGAVTVTVPTKTSDLNNDSNFVSGTGDSGYIPKFNGSHSITDLVEIDAGGTRYLKETGQWATPTASDVGALPNNTTYVSSVNGNSGAVTVQETLVSGTNIKTINNTSLLGSGDISIPGGGLTPLIGDVDNITPSQVLTAITEGRDVCIQAVGTLNGVMMTLKFTAFNYAIDIDFSGALVNAVVSQTITVYNNVYYLFELVGLINGAWGVINTSLAQTSDIPTATSELSNDSDFVSGTGANGYLTKWNSSGTVTSGPQLGASTTTYLRNDGQWAAPTVAYPTGTIQMYGGDTPPIGWLMCNGDAISRTTYSALFDVIGTTYGNGNGSTTFNLPDLRGRAPIGFGLGTATHATGHALGSKGGDEDAIIPYHNHKAYRYTSGKLGSGTVGARIYDPTGSNGDAVMYTDYAGTSGNAAGANMMPYAAVNFIIYAGQ